MARSEGKQSSRFGEVARPVSILGRTKLHHGAEAETFEDNLTRVISGIP